MASFKEEEQAQGPVSSDDDSYSTSTFEDDEDPHVEVEPEAADDQRAAVVPPPLPVHSPLKVPRSSDDTEGPAPGRVVRGTETSSEHSGADSALAPVPQQHLPPSNPSPDSATPPQSTSSPGHEQPAGRPQASSRLPESLEANPNKPSPAPPAKRSARRRPLSAASRQRRASARLSQRKAPSKTLSSGVDSSASSPAAASARSMGRRRRTFRQELPPELSRPRPTISSLPSFALYEETICKVVGRSASQATKPSAAGASSSYSIVWRGGQTPKARKQSTRPQTAGASRSRGTRPSARPAASTGDGGRSVEHTNTKRSSSTLAAKTSFRLIASPVKQPSYEDVLAASPPRYKAPEGFGHSGARTISTLPKRPSYRASKKRHERSASAPAYGGAEWDEEMTRQAKELLELLESRDQTNPGDGAPIKDGATTPSRPLKRRTSSKFSKRTDQLYADAKRRQQRLQAERDAQCQKKVRLCVVCVPCQVACGLVDGVGCGATLTAALPWLQGWTFRPRVHASPKTASGGTSQAPHDRLYGDAVRRRRDRQLQEVQEEEVRLGTRGVSTCMCRTSPLLSHRLVCYGTLQKRQRQTMYVCQGVPRYLRNRPRTAKSSRATDSTRGGNPPTVYTSGYARSPARATPPTRPSVSKKKTVSPRMNRVRSPVLRGVDHESVASNDSDESQTSNKNGPEEAGSPEEDTAALRKQVRNMPFLDRLKAYEKLKTKA